MALKHRRSWFSVFALLAIAVGVGWSFAQPKETGLKSPDPVTLLPRDALIYFSCEGGDAHSDAWRKTAAYQSLEESGVAALVSRTLDAVQQMAEQQGAGPVAQLARSFLSHLRAKGVSLAATVVPPENGPPSGYLIVVLHEAAEFEEPLTQLVAGATQGELDFQTVEQQGRTVTFAMIPNTPGVQVGWWRERGHLVLVAGIAAVDAAVKVADGQAPNVTENPLYSKYVSANHDFEPTASGWIDTKSVRGLVSGIPLPVETGPNAGGPLTVGHVLEVLGLQNLNAIVGVSGYRGAALWGETWIEAPGERTGLLALSEGEPLSLNDLPPLPSALNSFTATRFDAAVLYDAVLTGVRRAAAFAPSEEISVQVEDFIRQAREKLGMDVREELLAPLGNVVLGYDDSEQGLFNMGAGFVVKLDDPAAFKAGFDKLLAAIERLSEGQVLARRIDRQGREVVLLQFYPTPFGQSFCIDGDWLVIGSPQVVEAYLLRVDGKLPRWTPSPEHQAALEAMPREFSAIAVSDPRGFINLLAGLAPLAIGLAETGIRESGEFPEGFEFPIHIEDFPPAALVSQPLFPNVATGEVTAEGFHYTSRTSLPAIPLVGSGDAVTTTAVVAVGAALLLPAVQAARTAARRSQSQNNIKQLAIGLHNYADAHNRLPAGTILNADLAPEERLSWIVELLPYLEQGALYDRIDRSAGWKDNLQAASGSIEMLINPGVTDERFAFNDRGETFGATHYVGIAGLGEDGPILPVESPKAGIFAYDRKTRFADITDGMSNTLMISEASGDYGGWIQGGRATMRPFTQQPYINGPDGIGGPYNGGANMGFADGAVRFISPNIDPSVLEAITTIRGGEVVPGF